MALSRAGSGRKLSKKCMMKRISNFLSIRFCRNYNHKPCLNQNHQKSRLEAKNKGQSLRLGKEAARFREVKQYQLAKTTGKN